MCGIIGVFSRQPDQRNTLEYALSRLFHRGPDDHGFWNAPHIQLGHTRLSILDVSSSGHQPMSSHNQQYWLTYNGEIYNYVELRETLIGLGHRFTSRTDTEVLLAAYAQWGIACLDQFRGMFAFALWDNAQKQLFLARDRIGEKPLHYYQDQEHFYFASELKALLAMLPNRPQLSPEAVDLYLHYHYIPEPRTPLTGIWKLSAAHFLLLSPENWNCSPQRYWNLEEIPAIYDQPIPRIHAELERSITLTLRSDVPVGVALSGGIDSSAIAALAAPRYKDTLMAFSVGYPDCLPYDERTQAESFAKSLKIPFHSIELRTENITEFFPDLIRATDEPIADISAYGYYSVMKIAAEHGVKVMLTGFGGDELFWGYPWVIRAACWTEQKLQLLQKYPLPTWGWATCQRVIKTPLFSQLLSNNKLPRLMRHLLRKAAGTTHLTPQYPQHAVFYDLVPDFIDAANYKKIWYTPQFRQQIAERTPYAPFEVDLAACANIPVTICRLLFESWLVSNCIALGDRLSMASSVETRLPLLDYKLVETVIGLRKAFPDHTAGHKYWLKAALKNHLPDEIIARPKQGFQPPINEWMEAILRKHAKALETGYLLELNILAHTVLQRLLSEFAQQRQHTFLLYKLLVLEMWYQRIVMKDTR